MLVYHTPRVQQPSFVLLIGLDFPSSADWAIGLLVGIDLLFAGWGLLTVSGLGKRLASA